MLVITKGDTQSYIYPTVSENANKFPEEPFDPVLFITNDTFGTTYSIYPLMDLSATPGRYNKYEINETTYDFKLAIHSYVFYMCPTSSSVLEYGKFNVVGTISSTMSQWYNRVYQ